MFSFFLVFLSKSRPQAHVCMCVHVCVSLYIYIYVYVSISVYPEVYIFTLFPLFLFNITLLIFIVTLFQQ